MTVHVWVTLAISIPYLLLLTLMSVGWRRVKRVRSGVNLTGTPPSISIVIPVRNEQENLDDLLEAISRQDYPRDRWEVVVVDDHSGDGSKALLDKWAQKQDFPVRVMRLAPGEAGKKAALSRGIEATEGELIVTTDADCQMGPQWLASTAHFYQKHHPSLIFGPVLFESSRGNFFTHFQSLEFLTLLGTAAGSSRLGHPLFGNAANMAFPRKLLERVDDPFAGNVVSGDDTLLLLKVKKLSHADVAFNPDLRAKVETTPAQNLKDFWSQRKRWASKSRHYHDFDILGAGLVVLVFNLWLMVLLAGSLFHTALLMPLLMGFFFKTLADSILLTPLIRHFGRSQLWKAFLPAQLVYPFFSTLPALAGQLVGFKWKNRRYHVN
jgi:cellulose synthase/poly-beta-1,6-N-acetylglucosamine synthase-like glycosyltransferase